jgi:hypothetical protein
MIISIDFVGGIPPSQGATHTVAMAVSETAGVKPATHWNSAATNVGTLASLVLADGTASSASAKWDVPLPSGQPRVTFSLYWTDAPGNVRMMNGFLDPVAIASPATISVAGLPSPMSAGYDVYVYCYGNMTVAATRPARYTIGSTTHNTIQTGPMATSFGGYVLAPEGGAGNYVLFRNMTGTDFTLTAQPMTGSTDQLFRAPVNGIQIVYPAGS